jgi:hypothetical protein
MLNPVIISSYVKNSDSEEELSDSHGMNQTPNCIQHDLLPEKLQKL